MFNQIRYFQAVVRLGSFTQAANENYISQSAISQQIQSLEKELGVKLLKREKRKFTLTPAGEYFYQQSLRLLEEYEKISKNTLQIAQKEQTQLRIGYLKCYSGQEFQSALAEFSRRYPDVMIQMMHGNHEELYDALRMEKVDLVLNDQRRAFSDEYVNYVLTQSVCFIEIAVHHPIANHQTLDISDLKDIPCILIASADQQENERTYYQEIVGIQSEILFANNLEEGRLMVISGKGYMPVEGKDSIALTSTHLKKIPLLRKGVNIKRTYCAFWKSDNSGYYIEEFADILKSEFA